MKSLFAFRGRIDRGTFFLGQLALCATVIVIIGVAVLLSQLLTKPPEAVVAIVSVIIALPIFLWSVSLTVRRLHDMGLSGWWYWAHIPFSMAARALAGNEFIILLVAFAPELILLFTPGTHGKNRFDFDGGSLIGDRPIY